MPLQETVLPDTEGFLPNGFIDPYPHMDFDGPCIGPCCMPEAYPDPDVWTCTSPGCRAKLRHPGECINCCPGKDEYIIVQFCPCGHFYNMLIGKVVELIGIKQINDTLAGTKLDAPILPSEMCDECKAEDDRQERLCSEMDLDLF